MAAVASNAMHTAAIMRLLERRQVLDPIQEEEATEAYDDESTAPSSLASCSECQPRVAGDAPDRAAVSATKPIPSLARDTIPPTRSTSTSYPALLTQVHCLTQSPYVPSTASCKAADGLKAQPACSTCGQRINGIFLVYEGRNVCEDCNDNRLSRCSKCSGPIGGVIVDSMGEKFHPECHACSFCGQSICGEHITYEDWKVCLTCNSTTLPKCARCCQPIGTNIISADNKQFHPECFACSSCGKSIDGLHVTLDGQCFCVHCHERKLPKCVRCSIPIKGIIKTIAGEMFHQECLRCSCCDEPIDGDHFTYEDRKVCYTCNYTKLPQCAHCAQPIGIDAISAGDKQFHPRCFACSTCGESIEGAYVTLEGRHVCMPCNDHKLPRCAKCAVPIGGMVQTVDGENFHMECLRCSCCNEPISGEHFSHDNQKVCLLCNHTRLPKCARCLQPINTEVTKVGDKQFHQKCFSCSSCGDSLTGPYVGLDTWNVCKPCYDHKLPKCGKCSQPIGRQITTTDRGQHFHTECFTV